MPIRLYSRVIPPAANPSPRTEVIDSPATNTMVRTLSSSVVPVTASITPRTIPEVKNVRITFASPFSSATGANPNGVITWRSKVPHCTSLPMSFEIAEYAPTERVHRKYPTMIPSMESVSARPATIRPP